MIKIFEKIGIKKTQSSNLKKTIAKNAKLGLI
jgi:hypothetical protein